jgi:membrane-bound inhibitor of C-type lysozyme
MNPTNETLAFLVMALSLFLAVSVRAQEAPATPSAPAASAAPHTSPTNTMRRAVEWKRFDYTCEKGAKLAVYLRDPMAKVRFGDKTYLMKQVPSADGARYSDGKVMWWSVGNGGFLREDLQDGNGAMLAKDCKLEKPRQTSADPAKNP